MATCERRSDVHQSAGGRAGWLHNSADGWNVSVPNVTAVVEAAGGMSDLFTINAYWPIRKP
jgi:hypothetical protein